MLSLAAKFSLAAFMIMGLSALALPDALACEKCKKHNTSAEAPESDDEHEHEHSHEHGGHEHEDEHADKEQDEEEGFVTILGEGHTDGWTLNEKWMKIEDGMLIAGSFGENEGKDVPKTMYAAHDKEYHNFELRADIKVVGPEKSNGGFQIRSSYNEKKATMAGYQADVGDKYWGRLYEQSRGRGLLGKHEEGVDLKEDINWNGWNSYVVRCEGPRIRIWINGKLFTDYTETNKKFIGVKGRIGLQLHFGPPSVRYHRNIRIKELD